MRNKSLIKRIGALTIRPIEFFYYIKGRICKHDRILFYPHPQMSVYDHYDLINYKSDSALTFLHYLLSHGLQKDKKYFVVISDTVNKDTLDEYVKTNFPAYDITFYQHYCLRKENLVKQTLRELKLQNIGCRCEFIFTSRASSTFIHTLSTQKMIDLGYFAAPFKNDIYLPMNDYKEGKIIEGLGFYKYVTVSEVARRLIYPTFAIPYDKYVCLGMCRNDNMLDDVDYTYLRGEIIESVSYDVKKILLYTPTHRDHFSNKVGLAKTLLGFDVDLAKLDEYLQENHLLIVCKLHPKYHPDDLNKNLPESIRVHKANQKYGLTELMRISDALMTDYTSGYFDYLLLDKPVMFNFFDYEEYRSTRGFTFEPISSIMAGDIITDPDSLLFAFSNIDTNNVAYKEKRAFVRDLVFKHQDHYTCERVYNYFF